MKKTRNWQLPLRLAWSDWCHTPPQLASYCYYHF